jgi:hypothetical protein
MSKENVVFDKKSFRKYFNHFKWASPYVEDVASMDFKKTVLHYVEKEKNQWIATKYLEIGASGVFTIIVIFLWLLCLGFFYLFSLPFFLIGLPFKWLACWRRIIK